MSSLVGGRVNIRLLCERNIVSRRVRKRADLVGRFRCSPTNVCSHTAQIMRTKGRLNLI